MSDNIIHLFKKQLKRHPEKKALLFDNTTYTYADIASQVALLSEKLTTSGIKQGDNVGVLLPNCPEFVILMLVAANTGICLVPQNITLPVKTIIKTFSAIEVQHLFAWHSLLPDFKKYRADFTCCLSVGGSQEDVLSYDKIVQQNRQKTTLQATDVSVSQPYILTMTSGSTGAPKPIVLLQKTKIARILSTVKNYHLSEKDIILTATPLYHSLAERLVLLPLLTGGTSVLMAGFTPKEWIEKVNGFQVTFTMAVSSQLKQIYCALKEDNFSLTSLKCLVSSSELLDANLKKELIAKINCAFYECYGTSEVACVTNISDKESNKGLSVGRPLAGVQLKILKEDKTLAAKGELGEIICKTPLAFSGYYKRPEMTRKSVWNGFFCTGDLGRIDEDGYLYFQGRKKDIIVTGGINVYPKDIENVINTYPSVVESSTIPLPDNRLGEAVTVVVVTKDNALPLRELQRLCARELADFQQPREYILIDKLPKNAIGKILKRLLVEKYTNRTGADNDRE